MNVVPGWLWLALVLATIVMFPAMSRRWQLLRNEQPNPQSPVQALVTVLTKLWLPAAALMVPAVYAVLLLFF